MSRGQFFMCFSLCSVHTFPFIYLSICFFCISLLDKSNSVIATNLTKITAKMMAITRKHNSLGYQQPHKKTFVNRLNFMLIYSEHVAVISCFIHIHEISFYSIVFYTIGHNWSDNDLNLKL